MGGKFKFSAQDRDLEYLCWRSKNLPVPFDLVTFYDVIFDGFMKNCYIQKFINQLDLLKIEITRHESTSIVDRKPLIKFSNSLLFYILNRENKHMDIFASRAILIIGLRT